MTRKKNVIDLEDSDNEFDWGFCAVDEEELPTSKTVEEGLLDWKGRTERMYKMILPLLSNLQKNPEKDYIYWPNREDKIDEFRRKLEEFIE